MIGMKIKKVKTSALITGLMVELIFSIFLGIIAVSIGLGSIFPQLNLIAGPFLCPGQEMAYTQNVTEIGSDTYWSAAWFCVDEGSGSRTELDPDTVHGYAGSFYGVLIFIVLLGLTVLYWNSGIGPAKNDGLHLW
jgi:hypothetical protein